MANAEDVLNAARNEIGYCRWDDPEPGTKYGRWYADKVGEAAYGRSGVAFCAMFVSWILEQVGASCPGFPEAYCPYAVNKINQAGRGKGPESAQPGDVLLFDWDLNRESDHVGFVESNEGNGIIKTIEGNTKINGRSGSVGRRIREYKQVYLVVTPDYDSNGSNDNTQPSDSVNTGKIDEDGCLGPNTAVAMQRVFTGQDFGDRRISSQSYAARRYWECDRGGIEFESNATGSNTINAMQRLIGVDEDGFAGHDTTSALQRFLVDQGYDVGPAGDDGYIGYCSCIALQQWLNSKLE